MNNQWEQYIESRLTEAKEKDLFRSLNVLDDNASKHIKIKNKKLINFASNNYLGLAIDDMAVAPLIFQRAKEKGIGTELTL